MIYFAQIGRDGPIKIGESDNPQDRVRSLQTSMPWKLTILRIADDVDDSEVYHYFSASRMRGEWFYPTKELLDYINQPFPLPCPDRDSWKVSRAQRGSNPAFLRPIVALCGDAA